MQKPQSKYTPLAELAADSGASVPCTGNLPVVLDDPDSIWYIEQGSVNLFLVELVDGVDRSAPQFLMSRESGCLLPGVAPDEQSDDGTTLQLVAKGLPDTRLRKMPASIVDEIDPKILAAQFDSWMNSITDRLSIYTKPLPRPTSLAKPGTIEVPANGIVSVRHEVIWVSNPARPSVIFMDFVNYSEIAEGKGLANSPIPLTRTSWVSFLESATLTGTTSETLAARGEMISALASFHAVALNLERLNRRLAAVDDVNLEKARTRSRRVAAAVARQQLFNIYDQPIDQVAAADDTTLIDALRIVGEKESIDFIFPARSAQSGTPIGLIDVLSASGVRARRVQLDAESNWWWSDSNTLLAFRKEDGQPVVLVPGVFGRYREIDPLSKRAARVTASSARGLKDEAWTFYRPLSAEDTTQRNLARIAFRGAGSDIARLVIAGIPHGVTKLAPAFALGAIANHVLAGGDAQSLYVLTAALAGIGLIGALFHMLQNTAFSRLKGRSTSRIEAAFWDHLMRLPASVVQRYSAGDLAILGMSFQKVRDSLQDTVTSSFLSIIFLLPIFVIISFYDTTLGFIALAFSLTSLLITVILGLRQIFPYEQMISASRRVAGNLFQMINGIIKLREGGAEGSAFAIWARNYRQLKRAELELSALDEHARAFSAALPFLASGVLLFAVMSNGDRNVPIADFLVVFTVFIVFQTAVARLGESLGAVAALYPALKQMEPLLSVVPETESKGEPVEFLGGDVLFDRVSFRYKADGPLILDDVTIHAQSGEFIALAGESGSGKSTLFKLALGAIVPTSGAVYYDERDLKHLNLKQVRQKIGSVPQSVQLHPHDIWDNIAGHHDSVETGEIWAAARIADIEKEIKRMPMGLMTMVGSSGEVLSGGESQRITLARSVMRNPRIMLLDEATNWMDNDGQAKVMENLAGMTFTRIVIAHRLSTLKSADRIYVLQSGKVVESGSYAELMEAGGEFTDLVKRQIA